MKKYFISYLMILFNMTAFAQSADYFIELAKEKHPQLKSETLRHQAVEKRIGQFSIWQDPVLSAAYNVTPNSMEKANVSLMQNFSWFGTVKTQQKAVSAAIESSRLELRALEKQLGITIKQAYLDLQEARALLAIQEENRRTFESLQSLANNKLSTAKGTLADVVRAEISKENAELEMELLKLEVRNKKQLLNSLSGRDVNDEVEIEPISFSTFISTETKIENHPEVAAVASLVTENEWLKAVAEKESMPTFGVGVEYMRMAPDHNEFMPMVSLSLPIFRSKYKARVSENVLLMNAYQFEKEWKTQELERNRLSRKTEIESAMKEVELYEKQLLKTERMKQLLLNYYSTSGNDFQEVIRAQQEEINYRIAQVKAETRLLKTLQEWEYLNLD